MDEHLSPALARRLAAYAATAGVALAVSPAADAQIVYHDYVPDLVAGNDLPLDFDDTGGFDIWLDPWTDLTPSFCPIQGFDVHGESSNQLAVALFGIGRPGTPLNAYYYYLAPFPYGAMVGPVGRWSFEAIGIREFAGFGCKIFYYGHFYNEEGYAGFRFIGSDGDLHYGWMRLRGDSNGFATVYEYAYEASPDIPIAAGALSDATLSGSVNQTTFPASGGTLRYTFTVVNRTDGPLPLDLWVQAERIGGVETFVRGLGSGTLAPGATVTGTTAVRVLPNAPAGTYEVDFRLGDFASGEHITFQRFTVLKSAPPKQTGAEAVAGGGEPFGVERIPGDLFASSGVASAGVAGTYVLSGVQPNPAPGRAELTLQVSEAQGVRVEVLDALGRRVALLHDGPMAPGAVHRLVFDGSALPAGVYVVRAVGEGFSDARVLTLMR